MNVNLPQGEHFDLVVFGGGIMGMACAFEEASQGRRVALIDSNLVGKKASWAAAGILISRAGIIGCSPIRDFYLRSLLTYNDWLERVSKAAKISLQVERDGDYQIFPKQDKNCPLTLFSREGQLQREKASDFTVTDSLPPFLESHSNFGPTRVFHFPHEAHINSRSLLTTLETALRNLGVTIFSGCQTKSIETKHDHCIKGDNWELHAEQLLIATGVWCNEILQILGFFAPVSPVKGQVALLPNFHGQNCMMHIMERFYLVPRNEYLVVGSTTESGVWDEAFDEIGNDTLGQQIQKWFPKVKPLWVDSWTGLRPRTQDRLPYMGWLNKSQGIAICGGHYKSGISLAPLAAKCMSALLNGKKPPADLKPFDPLRLRGVQQQNQVITH